MDKVIINFRAECRTPAMDGSRIFYVGGQSQEELGRQRKINIVEH